VHLRQLLFVVLALKTDGVVGLRYIELLLKFFKVSLDFETLSIVLAFILIGAFVGVRVAPGELR